jgi:hypothetical protein
MVLSYFERLDERSSKANVLFYSLSTEISMLE